METKNKEPSLYDIFIPFTVIKAIVFIVIIGLVVYFNSLFNNFVGDDYGQILYNTQVHSLVNIPTFFRASTFITGSNITGIYYKPLLLTTYSILYTLYGANAFFFHFFQLILYIGNAILLFILLKKFIRIQLAFLLSVIFLVHPIDQSVAAYIAALQDTMFFFFGILALLISTAKKIKHQQLIVYSLLIVSLLSKETGIGFLFINLLYILLYKRENFKRNFFISLILLLIYGIIHFLSVGSQFILPQSYHITRLPLQERLLSIPAIMLFYLQTFLYPQNLALSYDWIVTNIGLLNFYIPVIIITLFFIALVLIGKFIYKKKHSQFSNYLFFSLWFLIGLSFHLQIIPLDGTVSTSWFYLPIAGLLGVIGIFLEVFASNKTSRTIINIFALIITLIFSIVTIERNAEFTNNLTLMCHDANETHTNFALENSCGGSLLYTADLYEQAQKHLELSVQLAPYFYSNWSSLGVVLGIEDSKTKNMKLIEQSENDFRISIKNNPLVPSEYEDLGYMYVAYNNTQTANFFLSQAVKKFPTDYQLWLYSATSDYLLGNKKAAVYAIDRAYLLNPTSLNVLQEYNKIKNGS
jgi:hypothetical protein